MNTTCLVVTSPLSNHQSMTREATALILLHNQNCIRIFSALKSYIRKQLPLLFTYVTGSTKTTTKLGWQGQSSHSSIERGRKDLTSTERQKNTRRSRNPVSSSLVILAKIKEHFMVNFLLSSKKWKATWGHVNKLTEHHNLCKILPAHLPFLDTAMF